MARRRYLPPDQDLVHVSFKCVGDAYLMRPDAYTNYVNGLALAGAVAKYGVRVHAFTFLSNHAHLLLGVRGCRLDSFMQYVKSRIATELNVHRGRDGAFFKHRYRAEPILSEPAAVGIEQYVHQQAVVGQLVERALEWPGLSSYPAMVAGLDAVEVSWFDDQSWREAGARTDEREKFLRLARVPLSPLPHRAGLGESARRTQRTELESAMREVERRVALSRRDAGARRLPKPSKYTTDDPYGSPSSRRETASPQPWAHGSDDEVGAFREAYDAVMRAYDAASAAYRATGIMGAFPAGTFPPRLAVPLQVT